MLRFNLLSILILSCALCNFASAAENEISGNLGWGHPLGVSIQYSRIIDNANLIGLGIGFSGAGAKYGISYEYLMAEDGWGPFGGISAAYAGGASEMNVNVNADSAVYSIHSGYTVTPRAGARYQGSTMSFQANFGYSIVLSGGGADYVSGSTSSSVKNFAELVGLGGIEISVSVGRDF